MRSESEELLSKEPDGDLFEKFAQHIVLDFGAKITQQLNGLDEWYWDFQIREVAVTLHLQTYLGIMLFPARGYETNPAAGALVKTIATVLKATLPHKTS